MRCCSYRKGWQRREHKSESFAPGQNPLPQVPAGESAGVNHVGDGGFDVLLVFVVERQAPHLLAGFGIGLKEAFVNRVIIGKGSNISVSERDYDRAGQRGGID